jgi:hypothetical protein
MLPSTSSTPLETLMLKRRGFMAAAVSVMLLSACSETKNPQKGDWATTGTKTDSINHDAWDRILASYVKPSVDSVNRVNYKELKAKDAAALKAYVKALEGVTISTYPKAEQFAFWVNLYNAATVQVIVDNYPIDSIKDIGLLGQGPWKDKFLKVQGKALSLDDIEHSILRPIWKDVRIHYAVNCASIGCPNLALKAYRADTLEPMLEEAARAYINHARGFARIDGQLVASNIFEWYETDWGSPENVLTHARKYATGETAALLKDSKTIDAYDYDWSLNDSG